MCRKSFYENEDERKAAAAAKRRYERLSQSDSERKNELEKDRTRKIKSQQAGTEEAKVLRQQSNAESQAKRRRDKSPLSRLIRMQKDSEGHSQRRQEETEEELLSRHKSDAIRHSQRRQNETEEELLSRRRSDVIRHTQRREEETDDDLLRRRTSDAICHYLRRQEESEEESFRRKSFDADSHKQHRLEESNQESQLRKLDDADRHRLLRQRESEENAFIRKLKDAENHRSSRKIETVEEKSLRQSQNASAQRIRREHESQALKLIRQTNDRQIHRRRIQFQANQNRDQLQQQANYITDDETVVIEHSCGEMNVICSSCGSFNFVEEKPKDNLFSQCCQKGKVSLPIQEYPKLFRSLMTGEHEHSVNFMENIRSINSANAFASMGANISAPPGFGPYVFRVHGQIMHRTGTLHPEENEPPKFAQLYILDPSEATTERMQLKENQKCNMSVMDEISGLLQDINEFANAYKMLREVELEEQERALRENREMTTVAMAIKSERSQDQRRYNQPRVSEVAVIFQNIDGEPPFNRDILIHLKPNPNNPLTPKLQRISILHGSIDALLYPIFYPRGEEGWHPNLKQNGSTSKRVTQLQYYSYLLSQREYFNPLLNGGKLSQQFVVDAYVKIEANRINFIKMNQQQLKVEDYSTLQQHLQAKSNEKGIPIGKTVILPSTFEGSARNMQQRYQDAISIVAKHGRPDLFVTMTCNSKWKEITENLQPWQRVEHRPDLVARVFRLKLKSLLKDIKEGLFGNVIGMIHVIEFQKRGLPHAHILIILDANSKIRTEEEIDNIVWAEIPDKSKYPELHNIVISHMIHGPCGNDNPNCPCMSPCSGEGEIKCSKGFPKDLRDSTNKDVNGYPSYRRRSGADYTRKGKSINNSWVVPYNPFLLKKYNCHINVEVCASIKSVKYLFKYVYKGHDQANVSIQEQTVSHDEPSQFVDSRYISAPEAIWRIFSFPMHSQSHTIVRLAVHLPNQQQLYFHENSNEQNLQNVLNKTSTLLGWFDLNKRDPDARQYLYHEIPEHYVWDNKERIWKPRQRGADKVIGRMYTVNLADSERYYMRLLLLHFRGSEGFDDLKTVNRILLSTFKDAALARGLCLDDGVWKNTLLEGALLHLPKQLREMFGYICVFGPPANPLELWMEFKEDLIEDFCLALHNGTGVCTECESLAMKEVNKILQLHGKSFETFGLPIPSTEVCLDAGYDVGKELDLADKMIKSLNQHQQAAFDAIVMAMENHTENSPKCFFLDGPGGSGKTFLYEVLMHYLRSQEKTVLPSATTGIAANLLQGGRTMHLFYGIPVPINETSVSTIKPDTFASKLLQQADVLIVDECTMASKHALSVIDGVLKESMTSDVREKCRSPFGGKVIVLGGDFRQCLPVVPNGGRTDVVEISLKMSGLWNMFQRLPLINNMRSHDPDYSAWLLKLGNGELGNEYGLGEEIIEIPEDMLSTGSIVTDIFGETFEVDVNDPSSIDTAASHSILCPKNTDADRLNSEVIAKLPGDSCVYLSDDCVIADTDEERNNYPVEFLNSISPSGLPSHRLTLKNGTIIMLLRNLNTKGGLCNGTRLVVVRLHTNLIEAKIISGSAMGTIVLIPRIDFCPSDTGLPFMLRRRQFPIKPAFAMTINKSQGQTMEKVGIYLPEPVFSHGQLYVAFSRVRCRSNVKVQVVDTPIQGRLVKGSPKVFTRNVVYTNVL